MKQDIVTFPMFKLLIFYRPFWLGTDTWQKLQLYISVFNGTRSLDVKMNEIYRFKLWNKTPQETKQLPHPSKGPMTQNTCELFST